MNTLAAALLLVAATSGGAAASAATPPARCAAARPVVSTTETSVEARVLTGCTAGELVVFHTLFVARATGSACSATGEELEADPATPPQWIRTRVELVCAPGEKGRLGAQVTVEMHDARDTRSTYGFGDSFTEQNPAARHIWHVEFLAGLGDLPVPVDPAQQSSNGAEGAGSTRAQFDHVVYDG